MTPDHAADLARLRAFLPPIVDDYDAPGTGALLVERVIDLEWHRAKKDGDAEEQCGCGRDLPDGTLEMIGIGNDKIVVQLDWQAMSPPQRSDTRLVVQNLITTGVTIYHNADADIRKMRENGFKVSAAAHARLEDTMLADAVTDSEERHRLGDLNQRHGRLPDFKHLKKVAPREYNAGDLVGTYWVWKGIEARRFAKDPQAHTIYRRLSVPFIDLGIESEEAGVRVNGPVAVELYHKYAARVESARSLARGYTGDPLISLSAPDQLKQWCHKVYGLPEQMPKHAAWDEEVGPTLNKDALATLRRHVGTEWDPDEEPTLDAALAAIEAGGNGLLEAKYLFAGAQQRLTHYVMPCVEVVGDVGVEGQSAPGCVVPRARIFPELRQHVQATGRHSYVRPAVQQMKGETARLITPDPGTVWVSWDWSQIEVRLLAYLANDEVYLDAYRRGLDIHDLNAQAIFGTRYVKGDEVQRGFVKRFVFRIHYRGNPKYAGDIPGCRELGLNTAGLVAASEAYLAAHPALSPYWASLEAEAASTGMVRTFMGRPRRLTSPYPRARAREACNHPMQGGVADIYCETALMVKAAAPWARLVFGAHDAQTWQCPEDRADDFIVAAAPIANRRFKVNGHDAIFPAEFKAIRRAGD